MAAIQRLGALKIVAMVALLLLAGGYAHAASPVRARALVEREPLVQGTTSRIAIEIVIDPLYHIQSAHPHDPDSIATAAAVAPAPGIIAGAATYPAGEDILGPGSDGKPALISVYHGTVYILLPITVAADAAPGPRTLVISLTTQACDQSKCLLPTTQKLPVEVTVVAGGAGTASTREMEPAIFAAADRQTFAVALSPSTTTSATAPTSPTTTSPSTAATNDTVPLLSDEQQMALIQSRQYRPFNADEYPLALILLLSLVGGAILNIMPGVLPVIPLKVLSLVQQAHGDRRLALLHGLAFSGGVIALFMALAVVLKTAGLFYGQQFQSAGFLIAMVLFVVALALSMLGVWTINPPRALYAVEAKISGATSGALDYAGKSDAAGRGAAGHGSFAGSFANGLMATLLATPCSAPYLGPVLAWAFAQPAWLTALALGLVGVGMALPYLLLAMFPGALRKLPRAGRWSDLLKQALGIVMLGVAVYLVTLIANVTYWPWVMLAGVLVGLVCWAWGQLPNYNMALVRLWGIRAGSVAAGAVIGVILYVLALRSATAYQAPIATQGEWRPFNVALLDDALAHGRPVVVDWTASWCINCHWLEAVVLNTAPVREAFAGSNALLLKADLSTDNPPATLLNQQLGGESIPVLAIFSPSKPQRPVVLRDSYTVGRLQAELAKAR